MCHQLMRYDNELSYKINKYEIYEDDNQDESINSRFTINVYIEYILINPYTYGRYFLHFLNYIPMYFINHRYKKLQLISGIIDKYKGNIFKFNKINILNDVKNVLYSLNYRFICKSNNIIIKLTIYQLNELKIKTNILPACLVN